MSRAIQLSAFAAAMIAAAPVAATTIDFEAQGSGAPSTFPSANPSGPLTISGVTFTGGTLLNNETNSVDLTAVYATCNGPCGTTSGYANPITITFGSAVTSFSLDLVNEVAGSYIVTTNTLLGQNQSVAQNTITNFSFTGAGITSVTVAFNSVSTAFDFAIDNLVFESAPSVPEPATWAMLILGFGAIGGAMRYRRRARPHFA